jgi:hypothetical protein
MRKILLLSFALLFCLTPSFALSSGVHRASSGHRSASTTKKKLYVKSYKQKTRTTASRKTSGVSRSSHGRIKRSGVAKHAFMKSHPCPATGKSSGPCRGYVVDHIKPLASGGADSPSNMQWQTKAVAKEKDKWERK